MPQSQQLTKAQFYSAAGVVARVEWLLRNWELPSKLVWARLRSFSNGSADVCYEEGGPLYGYIDATDAENFLRQGEYWRPSSWSAENEQAFGVRRSELPQPAWQDNPDAAFEYVGDY
jgi:hypothetical protein